MKVTAWNNGSHHPDGNGYGIKLSPNDRDTFFNREWKTILVELEGESIPAEVNIEKASFWNQTCKELISVKIGKWLITHGLAPWPFEKPPVFEMVQIGERHFRLTIKG